MYQSWLVVVAIVALGSAPKGVPVRVRGESSGTVAFIDSVAVQAISSQMKAERVLKGFILRDL